MIVRVVRAFVCFICVDDVIVHLICKLPLECCSLKVNYKVTADNFQGRTNWKNII